MTFDILYFPFNIYFDEQSINRYRRNGLNSSSSVVRESFYGLGTYQKILDSSVLQGV